MKRPSAAPGSFTFVLTPVRESKLLGKQWVFERSTALGFSPDTLLHAATGMSLWQFLEKNEYRTFRALMALGRSEETGSRMQQGTMDDLHKGLRTDSQRFSLDEIKAIPNGLSAPWRILRRTLSHGASRLERRALVRLACFDRAAHQISNTSDSHKQTRLRERVFLPSLTYWHESGMGLNWESAVVLDATLHHLAWLDSDLASQQPCSKYPNSIASIAEPSRRPMRHWFDELLSAARCTDLMELHNRLAKRGGLRLGRPISHDLLKKWASTARLMPHDAAVQLLEASLEDASRARMHSRLRFARLLTVLGEFIATFSAKPVEPQTAQSAIHKRLMSLSSELRAGAGSQSLFLV